MTNIDMIKAYVEKTVRDGFGLAEVVYDSDGDIPLRVGTARYYVRTVAADPPLVSLFSPVLDEVPSSAKLLRTVNDINKQIVQARAYHHAEAVWLKLELLAETVTAAELLRACQVIGSLADEYDDKLKESFGGSTAFEDDGTEQSVEV